MLIEILLLFILLGFLLYRWITKSFDKWRKLGIPYAKPSFPYGSYNIFAGKTHLNDFVKGDYEKYKDEKLYGWFLLGKPVLAINDLDLLKNIQVKDFNHFVDRQEANAASAFAKGGDKDKLWGLSMDMLAGEKWKDVRSTFTPIFTSGKMKGMLKFIKVISDELTNEFEKKAEFDDEFELKSVFGKFSLDALASCAFGVNAESFTNEKSVFVKHAASVFKASGMENLLFASKLIPGFNLFFETFNINIIKKDATKFLYDIITRTLSERRSSKERKNDLIDMMLDALKNIEVDENEDQDQYEKDMKLNVDKKHKDITDDMVVATAMVFLVAGYDTTGMTLSYLSYAMSKNPEIQERLQDEIDQAFEEAGGDLPDYNVIQSLSYVDMVFHETLRFFNPIGFNTRSCTEDYNIPGTDITVKKDDLIGFSVEGIHKDPRYWTNPQEFYPEHFSKEEKSLRNPYAFQGFGQGPRACIGMRFALLEAKVAILKVFRRFSFQPGTKTQEPLDLDPENNLGWPKGGLWAKVVERDIE